MLNLATGWFIYYDNAPICVSVGIFPRVREALKIWTPVAFVESVTCKWECNGSPCRILQFVVTHDTFVKTKEQFVLMFRTELLRYFNVYRESQFWFSLERDLMVLPHVWIFAPFTFSTPYFFLSFLRSRLLVLWYKGIGIGILDLHLNKELDNVTVKCTEYLVPLGYFSYYLI